MKCPACGKWNKPSLPHCFSCGAPFSPESAEAPAWRETFDKPQPRQRRVSGAEDPSVSSAQMPETPLSPDAVVVMEEPQEPLATEMNRLKDRRARGMQYLRDIRENAMEQGIAPTGTGVSIRRPGNMFTDVPDDPEETLYEPPEIRARLRESRQGAPSQTTASMRTVQVDESYYDDLPPEVGQGPALTPATGKKRKRRKRHGATAFAVWTVRALVLAVAVFLSWQGILYLTEQNVARTAEQEATFEMETITLADGFPGRRVRIAGEEGRQIYIQELGKSYVVVDGYAAFEVADYTFYEDIEPLTMPEMDVTLTPTVQKDGGDVRLSPIAYTVDIPLSPVVLISPEATQLEVSTSTYSIELQVLPGSRVMINGENISDTVREDGTVSYNPPIQAIGDNVIAISVRAEKHRENDSLTITFYREPQDIPLEWAPDTGTSTTKGEMTLFATTMVGAEVIVETPFKDFNDENLGRTGAFSFTAVMERVGYNTVRMRAIHPEMGEAVLEHIIYYVPLPNDYTTKAWALTATDYSELLNNIALRTKYAQIYECQGEIIEILSDNPQLAIMNTGTEDKEQLVMLENQTASTNKKWEVGDRIRIYADVNGLYNTMPKLIARYSYDPR